MVSGVQILFFFWQEWNLRKALIPFIGVRIYTMPPRACTFFKIKNRASSYRAIFPENLVEPLKITSFPRSGNPVLRPSSPSTGHTDPQRETLWPLYPISWKDKRFNTIYRGNLLGNCQKIRYTSQGRVILTQLPDR